MEPNKHKNNLATVLTFAVGTVVVTLTATLLAQFFLSKSEEHSARLASGESDYERHHPYS